MSADPVRLRYAEYSLMPYFPIISVYRAREGRLSGISVSTAANMQIRAPERVRSERARSHAVRKTYAGVHTSAAERRNKNKEIPVPQRVKINLLWLARAGSDDAYVTGKGQRSEGRAA